MERSGWGSIETSHAPNGQEEDEQRAQAEFWARFAAWSRRALRRPCAPPSWRSALRSAAGRRLRSNGGTTAFLSMVLSSFLFLRINLFANRVLKKAYRRATFSRVTILHVDARALRQ